ncbi:MAG: hypothetical protein ACO3Z6_06995 [Pseudomonadales bacterium]
MAASAIAHFGTTLRESPPPADVDQSTLPIEGELARTLRFLSILGLEPNVRNLYPGIGRQYIWSRGLPSDPDYLEIDTFTSYRAVERPPCPGPRIGDTIFRVTHANPRQVYAAWAGEGLIDTVAGEDAAREFVEGHVASVLVRGPQRQLFELAASTLDRAANHAVYVWTDPERVADVAAAYQREFDLKSIGNMPFHGIASAHLLRRARPGITVGLLTPRDGQQVFPRWSEDIFLEAGYSHFRLASFDKSRTRSVTREAFPDGGDVSFVYFEDSYLELVQIAPEDPTLAA